MVILIDYMAAICTFWLPVFYLYLNKDSANEGRLTYPPSWIIDYDFAQSRITKEIYVNIQVNSQRFCSMVSVFFGSGVPANQEAGLQILVI